MAISNYTKTSLQLQEIAAEYKILKDQLPVGAQIQAERTIQDFQTIHSNLSTIQGLASDDLRNRQINHLTSSSAEDGFSTNNQMLEMRVSVFVETFFKARAQNDLKGFFGCFAKGASCLSGRSESLYKYAASLEGNDIASMPDPEKSLFFPGSMFAELIMQHFDEGVTELEFKDFLNQNIDQAAHLFEENENNSTVAPFLEYLSAAGLYEEGETKDWTVLIAKLISSRYFHAAFEQTLRYVF